MKVTFKLAAILVLAASLAFFSCDDSGGEDTGNDPASSVFVSKSTLPPGEQCPAGGVQIDMGFDNNNNGILDSNEIIDTDYVCNGINSQVKVTEELPGDNCINGGQRIETGLDENGNGILDYDEVQNTSFVCGTSTGGSGSSYPQIIYVTPEPDSIVKRADFAVDIYFNEDMDESTIDENSVVLKTCKGEIISALVSCENNHVRIVPTEQLSYGVLFVCVYDTVANISNNLMPYNYQASISVGKWSTEEYFETNNPVASIDFKVLSDSSGNVITIYRQSDGTRYNLWANRYTVDNGWGTAQLIETENLGNAEMPEILMDESGNLSIVWRQYDGTRWNLWANRYTVDNGWGTAQLIETQNLGNAEFPNFLSDISGNITAVWRQYDGTRFNLWANRYTVGSGWGTAQLIETQNLGDVSQYEIIIDDSGNVIVIWRQYDGTRNNLWANRYTVGSGWGTAQLIETQNLNVDFPKISMDSSGNVTGVWISVYVADNGASRFDLWANRYTVGSGWGTAQLIETENLGSAGMPKILFDSSGNVTAVWSQSDGTRFNLWANRYTVGSGWGTAQLIETQNLGDVSQYEIIIDDSGNVIVIWRQYDGTRNNLWANRYTVGSGWGTAQLIETENLGSAGMPKILFDSSGNVTAVWSQSDGTRFNLWANRYTVGSGWGTAQLIETENIGDAQMPEILMDESGNLNAVWLQSDGTRNNLWANRYTIGSGWGTAQLIETENIGDAQMPEILMDESGNLVTIWLQFDSSQLNLWGNYYKIDSGWGTSQRLETQDLYDATIPKIQVNSEGEVVITWSESDGERYNLWWNSYDLDSGFNTAQPIELQNIGSSYISQLVIDATGNVMAVWFYSDYLGYKIMSSILE